MKSNIPKKNLGWCVFQHWFNWTEINSEPTQPSNIVSKSLEDIGVVAVVQMMHKNYTTTKPAQNRRNSGKKWWVLHASGATSSIQGMLVLCAVIAKVLSCCTDIIMFPLVLSNTWFYVFASTQDVQQHQTSSRCTLCYWANWYQVKRADVKCIYFQV